MRSRLSPFDTYYIGVRYYTRAVGWRHSFKISQQNLLRTSMKQTTVTKICQGCFQLKEHRRSTAVDFFRYSMWVFLLPGLLNICRRTAAVTISGDTTALTRPISQNQVKWGVYRKLTSARCNCYAHSTEWLSVVSSFAHRGFHTLTGAWTRGERNKTDLWDWWESNAAV